MTIKAKIVLFKILALPSSTSLTSQSPFSSSYPSEQEVHVSASLHSSQLSGHLIQSFPSSVYPVAQSSHETPPYPSSEHPSHFTGQIRQSGPLS